MIIDLHVRLLRGLRDDDSISILDWEQHMREVLDERQPHIENPLEGQDHW